MKRNTSNSHRDERWRSSRCEDTVVAPRTRSEEDKLRRRREWLIQQKQQREHERLKKKMILEYEIRRAREQGLQTPKRRSPHRSSSKSKSPVPRHRRTSTSSSSKPPVMSEKVESSSGSTPLFKGPEGTQISETELRKIKVDIHRNIPARGAVSDLQRDIVNPEDVVLKRRDGEGSKPIFEREEIKSAVNKVEEVKEVEERRTVVTVDNVRSANHSRISRKRSPSPSSLRKRGQSPRRASSCHSRYSDLRHQDDRGDYRSSYKDDRSRKRSRDRSREHKERYTDRDVTRRGTSHTFDDDYTQTCRERRDYSRSRERERERERDSHRRSSKDERSYREYRDRSRERSRERRNRSRERRIPQSHYIEQVPVPVYYGNFPPRPIVVGPMPPLPMGRPRHPGMMGPVRPFPPRFFPPDMYRLGPPPNPRFGPMF